MSDKKSLMEAVKKWAFGSGTEEAIHEAANPPAPVAPAPALGDSELFERHKQAQIAAESALHDYMTRLAEREAETFKRNMEAIKNGTYVAPPVDPLAHLPSCAGKCGTKVSEAQRVIINFRGEEVFNGLLCPKCEKASFDSYVREHARRLREDPFAKPATFQAPGGMRKPATARVG